VLGGVVSGRPVCEQFTDKSSTDKSIKHTQKFNERKSAEDLIVTAQSTAYGPLMMAE
jgi:hypothetical protein